VNISLGGEKGAHARTVRDPGHHAARAPRRSHAHLTQHVRRVHVRHPRGRQGARDLQVRRVASPRANAEPRARARRRFSLADANARADADIRNPLAPPRRAAPRPAREPRRAGPGPAPPRPRRPPASGPPARPRPPSPGAPSASSRRRARRRFFPPRSATLLPTAMSEGYPVAPSRLRRAARPPRIASPRARRPRTPPDRACLPARPDAIARGARGAPDPDPVSRDTAGSRQSAVAQQRPGARDRLLVPRPPTHVFLFRSTRSYSRPVAAG